MKTKKWFVDVKGGPSMEMRNEASARAWAGKLSKIGVTASVEAR